MLQTATAAAHIGVGYNLPLVTSVCQLSNEALNLNRSDQVEHLSSVTEMTLDEGRAFYSRNHVTKGMSEFLRGALRSLHGESSQSVFELRQAMGGGKTHNMIMLGLLSRFPELAGQLPSDITEGLDLTEARVVAINGRNIQNYLWGDIALQLGGERFSDHWVNFPKPMNEGDWISLIGDQPTLIMLDELPPYLDQARARPVGEGTLLNLTTYSISNLLSAAMQLTRCVVVIGSLDAAYTDGGDGLSELYKSAISDLQKETLRGAKSITPVDLNTGEIYEILRKRLFDEVPERDDERVAKVIDSYAAAFQEAIKGKAIAKSAEQLADEIYSSYPFHPGFKDILSLFKENPRFRQTRGLIEFTANLLRAVWSGDQEVFLLGAQHLDFSDLATRDQVKDIEKGLEGALATDVYDADGSAHAQAIDARNSDVAAREVANLIFVSSLSDSVDGIRGLRADTITEYLVAPGRDPGSFKRAFDELRKECWYLHSKDGERWYFSDVANIRKQIEDKKSKIQQDMIDDEMRRRLQSYFEPKRKVAYQDLVVLPRPDDIKLSASRRTCFILSPDQKDPPETARLIFDNQIFRNAFCVVSGDGSKMASASDAIRKILAIEFVKKTVSDDRRVIELETEQGSAERAFLTDVKSLFNTVWYPTDKKLRPAALQFEAPDASKSLDGEAAVERALEASMKLVAIDPEKPKGRIEQVEERLFNGETRMPWTKVVERAANNPVWAWLPPKGLDEVKAAALRLELWTESDGQVDIRPAPPKPVVKIGEVRSNEKTGASDVELVIANTKGFEILVAETKDGLSSAAPRAEARFTTEKAEAWVQIRDLATGEVSEPRHWQAHLDLTYQPVQQGESWLVTFDVKPAGEIRWNTTGANPKDGTLYDGQPIRIDGSARTKLYVHAQSGSVTARKEFTLDKIGGPDVGPVPPEGPVRLRNKEIVLASTGKVEQFLMALQGKGDILVGLLAITAGKDERKVIARTMRDLHLDSAALKTMIDGLVVVTGDPDAERTVSIKSCRFPDYPTMKAFLADIGVEFTLANVEKDA